MQVLIEKFKDFARDTQHVGTERVATTNAVCDQLIGTGHSDAATIAEWKDNINELWADLLELIETRTKVNVRSVVRSLLFTRSSCLSVYPSGSLNPHYFIYSCMCLSVYMSSFLSVSFLLHLPLIDVCPYVCLASYCVLSCTILSINNILLCVFVCLSVCQAFCQLFCSTFH